MSREVPSAPPLHCNIRWYSLMAAAIVVSSYTLWPLHTRSWRNFDGPCKPLRVFNSSFPLASNLGKSRVASRNGEVCMVNARSFALRNKSPHSNMQLPKPAIPKIQTVSANTVPPAWIGMRSLVGCTFTSTNRASRSVLVFVLSFSISGSNAMRS